MFQNVRRGAIVVAHPDDESLWCGGLMARYPARWTVICCSVPRTDPIRAYKFFRACEVLGAKARLLPFPEGTNDLRHLDEIDLGCFDCVVTHNDIGEYGHLHHVHVHQSVIGRCCGAKSAFVPPYPYARRDVLTIGYGKPANPESLLINLNEFEIERKLTALRCYDHVSPSDGKPKWEALIERYSQMFDLGVETYDVACA